MAGGIDEALHDRINRKIRGHVMVRFSDCSIIKVPNHLREINPKAYEPLVISIGPYHHGKEHLKAMEVHKMDSLKSLLGRTGENSVEKYVTALREMVEEIRGFYSETQDRIGEEDLVEMMLRDGFFIIAFISHDPYGLTKFYWRNAMRDLLLVENQLPFFVLFKLYSLYVGESGLLERDASDMIGLLERDVITYFDRMVPGPSITQLGWNPRSPSIARARNLEAKHILALLYDNVACTRQGSSSSATASPQFKRWLPCLAWASSPQLPRWPPCLAPARRPSPPRSPPAASALVSLIRAEQRNWRFIRSATELKEAGIKFQKKEGKLFDIEFQKAVMSIPTLIIDDYTESIFRNFVAYEQYRDFPLKPFTDYITFMNRLINTGKDVELLSRCGVLDNWLGDHEVVATMFYRLRDAVLLTDVYFIYSDLFNSVNKHCNREVNVWMARLRHNYFNTPVAFISFLNAVVVLLLSVVLQTLFTILSYYQNSV